MNRFLKTLAMAVFIAALNGCDVKPCSPTIPYPQPGTCSIPGTPEGEPGGKCPSWPSQCGGGSSCIQGVCLPTGGDGEACTGLHNECDPGLTCDDVPDSHVTCSSTCGQLGQPCCHHSVCGPGNTCTPDQTCVQTDPPTTSACQGSTQYFVGTLDFVTRCAGEPISVMADDPAQATACAQATLQQLGLTGVVELVSPTLYPNSGAEHQFCSKSDFDPSGSSFTIHAHSDGDALTCAKGYCVKDCTITAGVCN